MRFIIPVFLLQLYLAVLCAQPNHYESIVLSSDNWSYFEGTSEPDSTWKETNFTGSWPEAPGGFGYRSDSVTTVVAEVQSLYLRKEFNIAQLSDIYNLILCMDYDAGFIAYINGHEIAREGIYIYPPEYDMCSYSNHPASFISGLPPEYFTVNSGRLSSIVQQGNNVLAIHVQSSCYYSDAFVAIPNLFAGINGGEMLYNPVPDWFTEPVTLTTSNLPIVLIQTENGVDIPDEPKIDANMRIIYDSSKAVNHINDFPKVYSGLVGIEIRGNYSAGLPQKPYGFETRNLAGDNLNIPLFHMPEENDWILLANYNDKVMMRNTLSFDLSRKMGHYAPRTKHCEVVLNGNYEGVYVLTEKIKRDKNRIDIAKLKDDDIEGHELTGGYIFKIDYYDEEDSWAGAYSVDEYSEVRFVYQDPKHDELQLQQKQYLQDYIEAFEDMLFSDDFNDPITGYRAYVNVESFIDYFIISEVARNCDAYKKSRYYSKEKDCNGGFISSGPVWDFDWAYKNINGFLADGYGWSHQIGGWEYPTPSGWMQRMLEDTVFYQKIGNRYRSLRRTILHLDSINAFIDEQRTLLDEAQKRHYQRWPILGVDVGTPEGEDLPLTYEGEVAKFKSWIATRITWLDANMPEEVVLPEEPVIEVPDNLCEDIEDPEDPDEPEHITNNTISSDYIMRVFPNPVTDYLYVESDMIISSLELYSTSGRQIVSNVNHHGYSVRFDLQDQAPGLYMLRVRLENGAMAQKKIIIK